MSDSNERAEQLASLATLGAGAIEEKFQAELKEVMENIRDPNTEAMEARKITLEFIFKPNADREVVQVAIRARSTFAATKPTSETMFVGRKDGTTVGTVWHGTKGDPRQGILPITEKQGEA